MNITEMPGARSLSSAAARLLVGALSPASRQRLSILIFHRVLRDSDPLRPDEPDQNEFRERMKILCRVFNVVPLREAVEALRTGDLPPRAAALTFDDGYSDNLEVAVPILREFGLPATVFVSTGYLNGGRMFNDTVIEAVRGLPKGEVNLEEFGIPGFTGLRYIGDNSSRRLLIREILPPIKNAEPAARQRLLSGLRSMTTGPLPQDLMMTDSDVKVLVGEGFDIGAHTVTHPILKHMDVARARWELAESKRYLEQLTNTEVTLFAYPNGRPGEDYAEIHANLAREVGFRAALSTNPDSADPSSDRYQLPRFTPWDRRPTRFLARLALSRTRWHH